MLISLIIPSHNEGDRLRRTVESCLSTLASVEFELIVVDDASEDDTLAEFRKAGVNAQVHSLPERRGPSTARHTGACAARGDVFVFMDAHCKPEADAIKKMAELALLNPLAIVTPEVGRLDPIAWRGVGLGYGSGVVLDLPELDYQWVDKGRLKMVGNLLEVPALVGMCFAMERQAYFSVGGFDPGMRLWGHEDLDLGFRAWMLGYDILNSPDAKVFHRFRRGWDNYPMPQAEIMANQMRLAWKNFSEESWSAWLNWFRGEAPAEHWESAWNIFEQGMADAASQRQWLRETRVRDEFQYALRFGCLWPPASMGQFPNRSAARPHAELLWNSLMTESERSLDQTGASSVGDVAVISASENHTDWKVKLAFDRGRSGTIFVRSVCIDGANRLEEAVCARFLEQWVENMPLGKARKIEQAHLAAALGSTRAESCAGLVSAFHKALPSL